MGPPSTHIVESRVSTVDNVGLTTFMVFVKYTPYKGTLRTFKGNPKNLKGTPRTLIGNLRTFIGT